MLESLLSTYLIGQSEVLKNMSSEPEADLASLTDLMTPWAIRVAVVLDLPDILDGTPVGVSSLAERVEVDPDSLTRLLRYLTCRGVFVEPEPGVFANSAASHRLCREDPSGWRPWLDLNGIGGRLDRAVTEGLLDSVRSGEPSYPAMYGNPLWTDIANDSQTAQDFDTMMRSFNDWWVSGVLEHDWSEVRRVVDVGGGTGGLLVELLEQWPKLTGTLVDLATNASAANDYFIEKGVADRADTMVGNFFEPLPDHGDAYLVAHILHDWSDEDAGLILRRCAEAAGPGGRVFVVERAVDAAQNSQETSTRDLRMMAFFGGRERELSSFREMARQAGLVERTIRPIQAGHYVMEFTPETS